MSEVLASLKKIGGNGEQYTETVLWTNSAPTSSFSAQAVTLSQGMADFKYLKIKVAPSTTSTSGQYFEDIILVSELQRTQSSAQEGVRDRLVLGLARTTYDFERSYYYASNTSIYFMVGAQAGASTTNNSRIIPLEILGINELAHGTQLPITCEQAGLYTVNSGSSMTYDTSSIMADHTNVVFTIAMHLIYQADYTANYSIDMTTGIVTTYASYGSFTITLSNGIITISNAHTSLKAKVVLNVLYN